MSKLWGGRFAGKLDPFFEEFNRSLDFDLELFGDDVQGSIGWATALGRAGVLAADEVTTITTALGELAARDDLEFGDTEDVHSAVEQLLTERIGPLARKLHTGRSRNDQVATDLKLYLRESCSQLFHGLSELQEAFVDLAERYADAPMPGYTHLQRAQPITIGHHALAYVEMLERDFQRTADAWLRMDTCPLGSGALAGTAFPIDREALAADLKFRGGPTRNSIDAVSDRDHVCEILFCCTMTMLHLSRWCEDWIFFATQEAGFLHLSDAVATGSSLMPQKKNPDALELIRGKTGRVIGGLQSLLVTIKGLPLAYDKDLQEDKEPLFDALGTVTACLRVAATVVSTATFDTERCRAQATRGYANATDVADLLVRAGVPFRDAHERTGKTVRRAIELGVEIEDLPKAELRALLPELQGDLRAQLSVDSVLARRDVVGGTAPSRVRAEVARWNQTLAERTQT